MNKCICVSPSFEFGVSFCIACRKYRPRQADGLKGRDLVRELVRIRDNHTCQSCYKKWKTGQRRFDVHHLNGLCGKKSRGYDRKRDMNCLITLCHKCHFNRPEHRCKRKVIHR